MKKIENTGILNINSILYKTRLSPKFKNRRVYKPSNPKAVISYLPGTVLDILVKEDQKVKQGEALLILDAMKMQNIMKCNIDGTIMKIHINKGDKVSKGTVLMELK